MKKSKQIKEFEENDLGEDIIKSGVQPKVVSPKQRPTSIHLGDDLIRKLKNKASKKGLPYQTFLKMVLRENLDKY